MTPREGNAGLIQPATGLVFPPSAWRGTFTLWAAATQGTTEAPEVARFAVFCTAVAVRLGRRVWFYYAYPHYANEYLVIFGDTARSKTGVWRLCGLLLEDAPGVSVIRGVGSGEALADAIAGHAGDQAVRGASPACLLHLREPFLLPHGGAGTTGPEPAAPRP